MYQCSECELWIGEEDTPIEPSRPCRLCVRTARAEEDRQQRREDEWEPPWPESE